MQKQIAKAIALYGGAFDPPHKGHLAILTNLVSLKFINEVWLLPSGDRNDKKLVLSKDERFDLLRKLSHKYIIENEKVKVTDEEIKLSKQHNRMIPTIQLLEYFNKKYPEFQFHFVIGSDILQTIDTWSHYERLLKEHKFIIYPRQGYEVDLADKNQPNSLQNKKIWLPASYYLSSFIPPEVSSTQIRKTIYDKNLSKGEKKQVISQFLDELTIQLLQTKKLL